MPDRIDSLHVFARVAALGGLSAASRALGISQSMATKHVAAVEARLGVKLLHRTTRRTTLTEAGRRYLETVEPILADLEAADAAAAAERVDVSGTLRLSAPISFSVRVLATVLAELSHRHPNLSIDLGLNDRVVELVDEGWDAAVRIGRIHDETLIARRLAPCRDRARADHGRRACIVTVTGAASDRQASRCRRRVARRGGDQSGGRARDVRRAIPVQGPHLAGAEV